MVTISTNIQAVIKELQAKLLSIDDKKNVVRIVAASLAPIVRKRIHVDGKAADGSGIGKYSDKYFKYVRPKYNRLEPKSKMVFSLTRTMENQFTSGAQNPNPTKTTGGYGLGFINPFYTKLAGDLETMKDKIVWRLTTQERATAKKVAEGEVKKIFSNKNVRGRL